jgi:hypothetical protein
LDIGFDVRRRNLHGRVGFHFQSLGPLQEFQESSVPPLQIIAARFGKVARAATSLETGAGPAGIFPGASIAIWPFVHGER